MREDLIASALKNLPGSSFEKFSIELLRRKTYPALIPTSPSHDLGEDANTASSLLFEHGGRQISLAISKTAEWSKINGDCERCLATGRSIDVLVFVTTVRDNGDEPTSETIDEWKNSVKGIFGWDLDVFSLRVLSPLASRPLYEDLVDQYLGIPPLHGDFYDKINESFNRQTNFALRQIDLLLPGLNKPIEREEIQIIEERLSLGKAILLTGGAGTGKSGIATVLITNGRDSGKTTLLIDARRLGSFKTDTDLRNFFDLQGPLVAAIRRTGLHNGCRVVIDQLDSVIGTPAGELLANLAVECQSLQSNVDVVVICRNEADLEKKQVEKLLSSGFETYDSRPLSDEVVTNVLGRLGIQDPNPKLAELGRNLLNLYLIAKIREQLPLFSFSNIDTETYLWERFLRVLQERDGPEGEEIINRALHLSKLGLQSSDNTFLEEYPLSPHSNRLISWGIVMPVEGRYYRFRHETFQDYIYAWNASEKLWLPKDVLSEVPGYKTSNILNFMGQIYKEKRASVRISFLREMLNVH